MRSPASAMRRYFSPPLEDVSGCAKDGVVCGLIQAWDTNTTNDRLRSGRSRYRTNALCVCVYVCAVYLLLRSNSGRRGQAGWAAGWVTAAVVLLLFFER